MAALKPCFSVRKTCTVVTWLPWNHAFPLGNAHCGHMAALKPLFLFAENAHLGHMAALNHPFPWGKRALWPHGCPHAMLFFFSWNAHLFYLIYLIEVIYLIHVIKLSYLYHVSYVIHVISLVVSDPSNPLNVFYLTIYIRAMAIQSYPFLFDLNYHVLLSQFI